MRVERAAPGDLPAIEALLSAAGLPLDGVREAFERGVLVRDGSRIVAAAAVESHGRSGLLRSVVVAPDRQGEGLGQRIVVAAEELARGEGADEVYLLTETAVDWFPRLGYSTIDRADVPPAVSASVEFTTACATSAVAMRRALSPGAFDVANDEATASS